MTAEKSGHKAKEYQARLFLIDDHPVVLQGLTQLINQDTRLMVCGQAAEAREGLTAIAVLKPDLVIIDIVLKSGSGLDLLKSLMLQYPKLPVLVLSMHDESLYAERVLRVGAKGYIAKSEATENLLTAIHRVLKGEIYLSDTMASRILSRLARGQPDKGVSPLGHLSDRELEVFQLIGRGHGSREIAAQLHLSVKTIETYRAHLKEKLRLQNATELIQHAVHWVQTMGIG